MVLLYPQEEDTCSTMSVCNIDTGYIFNESIYYHCYGDTSNSNSIPTKIHIHNPNFQLLEDNITPTQSDGNISTIIEFLPPPNAIPSCMKTSKAVEASTAHLTLKLGKINAEISYIQLNGEPT